LKPAPTLPEVIRLRDARGERPENSAGIGEFWYEPEVWSLPLSPDARVLYAGLCSYLGHREINRKDLRNTLKERTDREISSTLDELVRHDLLVPSDNGSYEVRPVGDFSV
jgi:preprotein translocase subunit Sec61beta